MLEAVSDDVCEQTAVQTNATVSPSGIEVKSTNRNHSLDRDPGQALQNLKTRKNHMIYHLLVTCPHQGCEVNTHCLSWENMWEATDEQSISTYSRER